MTAVAVGWGNLTDLIGNAIVKTTFGSPELAGIFLMGIITFFLVKAGVEFDGIAITLAVTVLFLSITGVFSFGFLFLPLVIGMLLVIGLAVLRVFRR